MTSIDWPKDSIKSVFIKLSKEVFYNFIIFYKGLQKGDVVGVWSCNSYSWVIYLYIELFKEFVLIKY